MDRNNSTYSYVVEPRKLSATERYTLANAVFNEAHQKIFHGIDFNEFYSTVFIPNSLYTAVMIYRNKERITGYASFHVYEVKFDDQPPIYIVMSEMGKTDAVHHAKTFVFSQMLRYKLLHPSKKLLLVDTIISPNSYARCCHISNKLYPRYNYTIPAKLNNIILRTANHFKWDIKINNDTIVRHLPWKVRANIVPKQQREHSDALNKHRTYYEKNVPDFYLGQGLVIICQITLINLLAAAINVIKENCAYHVLRQYKLGILCCIIAKLLGSILGILTTQFAISPDPISVYLQAASIGILPIWLEYLVSQITEIEPAYEQRKNWRVFDSIVDFICFIVIPSWWLLWCNPSPPVMLQIGLLIFAVAGCYRLIRFYKKGLLNHQFEGLPITYTGYGWVVIAILLEYNWLNTAVLLLMLLAFSMIFKKIKMNPGLSYHDAT